MRVAENLIKTYGSAKFTQLIQMFHENVSGTAIASEFEVSRQRVNQWKHSLGVERITYLDVEKAVLKASQKGFDESRF